MRGRTDFEDSVIQVRREEQAQEKRRQEAMAEALRARGVADDPKGTQFHAAQQKAIAARRLENERLKLTEPEQATAEEFSVTQLDAWDDLPAAGQPASNPGRSALVAVIALGAAAVLGFALAALLNHL